MRRVLFFLLSITSITACAAHQPIQIANPVHPCEAFGHRSQECTDWAVAYATHRSEQAAGGKCVCDDEAKGDPTARICEGMEITINCQ